MRFKAGEDNRIIAATLATIPIFWLIFFALMLILGTLQLGHIPNYGIDPDPGNLALDRINYFLFIPMFIGIFTVPAWILMRIHLLANKYRLTKKENVLHLVSLASLILFFIFKFIWSAQFLWVYD